MSNQKERSTWAAELISQTETDVLAMLEGSGRLPKHVAVIMDGNGRWAQDRGKPRIAGHREGMESVRAVVKASSQLGVQYLTLYAFSIENWKRPPAEVRFLMSLLETYLRRELDELHRNNVRVCCIGKISALPRGVQRILTDAVEHTRENTGLTLTLALSYGSRWDIVRAVQIVALDFRRGKLSPEDLTEDLFASYLQTASLPNPDLVIRTSGEQRLSNFLLWESAYSEIYVTSVLWPEFRREHLLRAIVEYACRERRFGKISAQVNGNAQDDYGTTLEQILHAMR